MITFKSDISKFSKAMQGLAKHVNVSTATFIKNEARLMSEELTKTFSPKQKKSEKGIEIDRRVAFRASKFGGERTVPWRRLQQVINRRRPTGRKPVVAAVVAKASEKQAKAGLGMMAAGFIGRGNRLQARITKGFVGRHISRCYGDVTISFGLLSKWVRIRNFTPWLKNMRGAEFLTGKVIRKRASSMRSQMRLIQRGVKQYWEGKK